MYKKITIVLFVVWLLCLIANIGSVFIHLLFISALFLLLYNSTIAKSNYSAH